MKPGLVVGRRRGLGAARSVAVLFALARWARRFAAEDAPKNLSCSFTGGAAWSYEAGVFQSKPPNPCRSRSRTSISKLGFARGCAGRQGR